MEYNYKDKYYNQAGEDLGFVYPNSLRFFTSARRSGDAGTRENPIGINAALVKRYCNILDGGFHQGLIANFTTTSASEGVSNTYINGTDMFTTKMNINLTLGAYTYSTCITWFKDLEFAGGTCVNPRSGGGVITYFYNCIYSANPAFTTNTGNNAYFNNCILKASPSWSNTDVGSRNTYLGVVISTLSAALIKSLNAMKRCDIVITQAFLSSFYNSYLSFDNCRFKFPSDTEYIALNGSTPEELRNDFIARCDANELIYNTVTEYDYVDVPLGRWLFTTDNSGEAIIYKDSDIDKFEAIRGIRFGFSSARPFRIKITNNASLPASINPVNPNSGNVVFSENSISFPEGTDITENNDFYVTSNIIPLNAIRQIDSIFTPNNLPWEYGFIVDAEKNIDLNNPILPGSNKIESGAFYIVRSTDKNYATAVYNGATYNTSLASPRANIIVGAAGVTSFTASQGNPVLFKILDNRQYQSVQIRIVNKIPADIIKTGNLLANYWYFVEHDTDQSNKTDYVTYNGVKYYVGSSFLVKTGVLTFTVSGNIHLRRCWNEAYNVNDAQDKAFWQNEQKPKWINVNADDMYCLMKSNNGNESEMQTDASGVYITSGHPDFYNMVLGSGGIAVPKYPIKGAYLQLKVVMSTLNLM
ncbi:MAG: hypothetical protein LBV43_04920 [Prevotella sp.]|jgi:hypothetical protein|nr:hypothetical protein [Prevotella sp.]